MRVQIINTLSWINGSVSQLLTSHLFSCCNSSSSSSSATEKHNKGKGKHSCTPSPPDHTIPIIVIKCKNVRKKVKW